MFPAIVFLLFCFFCCFTALVPCRAVPCHTQNTQRTTHHTPLTSQRNTTHHTPHNASQHTTHHTKHHTEHTAHTATHPTMAVTGNRFDSGGSQRKDYHFQGRQRVQIAKLRYMKVVTRNDKTGHPFESLSITLRVGWWIGGVGVGEEPGGGRGKWRRAEVRERDD